MGVDSLRTALESVPPERGLVQFTAGPFVTLGPAGIEGPAVGRATVRAVYEVRVTRHDSTAEVRRGPVVYGAFSAGFVIRSDSAFVMPGGRALVGVRPGEPPGITVGPFVEGADTGRPLSAR